MKPRRTGKRPDFSRRLDPQLALRFEAAIPAPGVVWGNGMEFAYLGQRLTLRLDTPCDAATLIADVLHLPLPPGAVARQIQDAVEAWLRQEARRVIVYVLERTAHCFGCPVPEWSFSFSALADWAQQHDDGSLRFNWHLIEQSPAFIEQIVAAALESTCGVGVTADLWSQGET